MTNKQRKGLTIAAISFGSVVLASVAAVAVFRAYMKNAFADMEFDDWLYDDDTDLENIPVSWRT